MNSLDHSLPRSSPKLLKQTPKELLRAFKSAALEVTTLYKHATESHEEGRRTGYQEALNDLLSYLDKENLGITAGEGWQIRQWAKDRTDGAILATGSESDEERDAEKRADSPTELEQMQGRDSSPIRPRSPPPAETTAGTPVIISQPNQNGQPKSGTFTFRSNHSYPPDVDMHPREISPEDTRSSVVKPEIHSRPSRNTQRNSNSSSRTAPGRSSRPGGGSKRKFPFGDYFDIGSFGDGKDGNGHGSTKRGRTG